MIDYGEECVGR